MRGIFFWASFRMSGSFFSCGSGVPSYMKRLKKARFFQESNPGVFAMDIPVSRKHSETPGFLVRDFGFNRIGIPRSIRFFLPNASFSASGQLCPHLHREDRGTIPTECGYLPSESHAPRDFQRSERPDDPVRFPRPGFGFDGPASPTDRGQERERPRGRRGHADLRGRGAGRGFVFV